MTAEKQLRALEWIVSTFGLSLIGLVIWGATLHADVISLKSQMKATWGNYNDMLKEKQVMMSEYSKLEQRVENIEKNKESEDQNNMLKKLFEGKKK